MFVCVVRDMNEGGFITISVCKPKIDDINQMALMMSANEEVIRFDVTVDIMLRMDVFNMENLGVRLASTRHSPQALERVKVTKLTNWLANIRTVLSMNLWLQASKRSSRDGPWPLLSSHTQHQTKILVVCQGHHPGPYTPSTHD
jgi:hypothetical protein